MVAEPAEIPETTPVVVDPVVTVATAVLLLVHEVPTAEEVNVAV
jgi:hypothetical protein